MANRTQRALLLAVGLLAGLLGAQWLGPARAQQDAQAWRGARWEYRVFPMRSADYEDKRDYREILAEHKGDGRAADSAFQEHVLNYLGQEGWELVGIERRFADQLHLYMKRPQR